MMAIGELTDPANLVPPRRDRSYPRAVKRARHNHYKVKTAADTGTRHATPAVIEFPNLATAQAAHQFQAAASQVHNPPGQKDRHSKKPQLTAA